MKKTYIKPMIEFERIVSNEAVANTCWGYHDKKLEGMHGEDFPEKIKNQMYCDIPGDGYIGFNITGGNCDFSDTTLSWTYFDGYTKEPMKAPPEAYAAFKGIISAAGGNNGQPFEGEGKVTFPTPDPGWS